MFTSSSRARSACRRVVLPALLLAWLACIGATAQAAPKTDVVVLVNGDRITGEVKSLEYNQLKLSTVHMGTIYIEWDKVASLKSDQYLLLERTDGTRYYGQLVAGDDKSKLRVQRRKDEPAELVDMGTVVRAHPIEGGAFVDRLDGYVSAGFDFAKANSRSSTDLAGGLSSRTPAFAPGQSMVRLTSPTTAPAPPASATSCRAAIASFSGSATSTRASAASIAIPNSTSTCARPWVAGMAGISCRTITPSGRQGWALPTLTKTIRAAKSSTASKAC